MPIHRSRLEPKNGFRFWRPLLIESEREREREEELLANFMELFGQQRIAKGRGGARRQAAAAVATFTHSMQLGRSHISYFSTPLGIAHINLSPSPPSWPLFTLHSYLKRSRTEAEAEGEEAQARRAAHSASLLKT